MNTEPLVTVIIPLYNKQRHLRRCVSSILAQSYPNLEVIIIDDHSTDGSTARAEAIARQHPSIRLISNPGNLGLFETRYVGIRQAGGEYITFVDADDWLETGAIRDMVELMLEHGVDLVQLRHRRRMRGMAVRYQECYEPEYAMRRIDGEEFRAFARYVGMTSYIHPAAWGKLYRTDLLRDMSHVKFEQFWGEDQIFNIQYLRMCRSMVFSDCIGYNYRWGGETTQYKYSALREYKYVHQLKRHLGQDAEAIDGEIKLLLRYHVRSLMTEVGFTRQAVEMLMTDELRDPLWQRVGLESTAAQLVEEESHAVQSSPLKYIAKRFLK